MSTHDACHPGGPAPTAGEPTEHCCAPTGVSAPISITINPEARVNVARTQAPLPACTVGEWVRVPIRVINEGFVTGPLVGEARPVAGVALDLPAYALTGADQDLTFGLRCDGPGLAEIELRFLALAALGGLADHATVTLLVRCLEPAPELAFSRA